MAMATASARFGGLRRGDGRSSFGESRAVPGTRTGLAEEGFEPRAGSWIEGEHWVPALDLRCSPASEGVCLSLE